MIGNNVTPIDLGEIDAKQFQLPSELVLEEIKPKYEYVDGKRTNRLLGHEYTVTKKGGAKNKRTFPCFVEGTTPLMDMKEFAETTEEVLVKLKDWKGRFRKRYDEDFNLSYEFVSCASAIEIVNPVIRTLQ